MIEDVIQEIFSDLNIPVIFIHKPDGYVVDDYITYNFTIDEYFHSNNENEGVRYMITFNYMTKNVKNVLPYSREIEEILKNHESFVGVKNRGTLYIKDLSNFSRPSVKRPKVAKAKMRFAPFSLS